MWLLLDGDGQTKNHVEYKLHLAILVSLLKNEYELDTIFARKMLYGGLKSINSSSIRKKKKRYKYTELEEEEDEGKKCIQTGTQYK